MPGGIDPLIADIVRAYLRTQEEASLRRQDGVKDELLRRGVDLDHPQAPQDIEQEEDYWSSEQATWVTTRTSWDIANS